MVWLKKIGRWLLYAAAVYLLLMLAVVGFVLLKKKEILGYVTETVNQKINGTFSIADFHITPFEDFPYISLLLTDPVIRDSLYSQHHQTLFEAKKICLEINVFKLFSKTVEFRRVTVSDAVIAILKTQTGYSNAKIFKPQPPSDGQAKNTALFGIEDVALLNVNFTLSDSLKNKKFGIQFLNVKANTQHLGSSLRVHAQGVIHFEGLGFNLEKGSYLLNKNAVIDLNLDYSSSQKKLIVFSSKLNIENNDYNLMGRYFFNEPAHFQMRISAKDVMLDQALSLITQNTASKLKNYRIEQPLTFAVLVSGKLANGSKPAVDLLFKSREPTTIMVGQNMLSYSELNGIFTNHFDSAMENTDQNSVFMLPDFSASYLGIIPLRSRIVIANLADPRLFMKAHVDMSLPDLNEIVDSSKLNFLNGEAHVQFKYTGKLVNFVDTVNNRLDADLSGSVHLNDADVEYVSRHYDFSGMNAVIHFDKSTLTLDSASVALNDNPLRIEGIVENLIPSFFIPEKKLLADFKISTPVLNLNKIITPGSFKKKSRKNIAAKDSSKVVKQEKKRAALADKGTPLPVSVRINELLDNMVFLIKLNADQLQYRNFKANNFEGGLEFGSDYIHFNNINMNTAGGSFTLHGNLTNTDRPNAALSITSSLSNVRINDLLYSFDNFSQSTITNKNIEGQLNAQILFNAGMRKDYTIVPKSMNGRIFFRLKNGKLLDFTSLSQISKYVFKNRDFTNIDFAVLQDTVILKGQDLHLSRMQIESNVLTFYVGGIYSFADNTNLSIQIPLSNLKKRDEDYVPKYSGNKKRAGISVFLKATTKDGKINIGYDPFPDKKLQ
ncbi:MAG: hypothetical protein H0W62_01190 [Chitinophagales bacterium]|nr:hypothetical protein [Chitinophagales bacterium]